jgi:hypothetical protein
MGRSPRSAERGRGIGKGEQDLRRLERALQEQEKGGSDQALAEEWPGPGRLGGDEDPAREEAEAAGLPESGF